MSLYNTILDLHFAAIARASDETARKVGAALLEGAGPSEDLDPTFVEAVKGGDIWEIQELMTTLTGWQNGRLVGEELLTKVAEILASGAEDAS